MSIEAESPQLVFAGRSVTLIRIGRRRASCQIRKSPAMTLPATASMTRSSARVETTDIVRALPRPATLDAEALDQESLDTDTVARHAAPTSVTALIGGFP